MKLDDIKYQKLNVVDDMNNNKVVIIIMKDFHEIEII